MSCQYRLPNGKRTTSFKRYQKIWMSLALSVCPQGWRVAGYDPDVMLTDGRHTQHLSVAYCLSVVTAKEAR